MAIRAIYENGVFRPLEPVALAEGSQVEFSLVSRDPDCGHPGLAPLLEIASRFPSNPDLPTDGAAQHDHYLYGAPKRP
jgi:hypothetical protein